MILKPAEPAPLTVIRMVEIINTVLPKDVVQVIPGLGADVPQAIVQHPQVRMVSFTGSTPAGAAVAKSASTTITPVVLELGGKNAFIVYDDADLDKAVRAALEGAFFNKGEACTAASRILVHKAVYEEFIAKLGAGVKKICVGDGMDPKTHVGPALQSSSKRGFWVISRKVWTQVQRSRFKEICQRMKSARTGFLSSQRFSEMSVVI